MIYYLANIVWDKEDILERNPKIFEAAKQRVQHIASSLNDVVIIISEGEGNQKGDFSEYHYKKNNNIEIKYLKLKNYPLIKRIYSVICLNKTLIINLKEEDKIICYNTGFVQIMSLLNLRLNGYKNEIILEFEEFYRKKNSFVKNLIFKILESIGINIANKFIITNKSMETQIRKFKSSNNKPILLSFGYINREMNIVCDDNKIIYYGGRMDYEGGVDIFIESLKYVRQKCKVLITGPYNEEYISKLDEIKNNYIEIEYLGFVDNKYLNKILSNQCICINPIRSKYEFSKYSFPSKILQYLQTGNIIISSNIECLQQLGELNNYISYFKDDDSKELAMRIEEKLNLNNIDKKEIVNRTFNLLNNDINKLKEFI